jgi:uroporphyrinogen-III synthase
MKIAITRLEEKKDDTQALFQQYGHEAILLHTMTTAPPENLKPLLELAKKVQRGEVDYLLFTSSLTVKKFFEHCTHIPSSTTLLCVGPKTSQAVQQQGYRCETLHTYNAEHFAEHLGERARGKTIGIPRAEVPNPKLTESLKRLGAVVIEAPAYQLKPAASRQIKQKIQHSEAILFTSGKSYQYANTAPQDLENKILIAIGPKTAQVMQEDNITPHIIGDGTVESCLQRLNQYVRKQVEP